MVETCSGNSGFEFGWMVSIVVDIRSMRRSNMVVKSTFNARKGIQTGEAVLDVNARLCCQCNSCQSIQYVVLPWHWEFDMCVNGVIHGDIRHHPSVHNPRVDGRNVQ